MARLFNNVNASLILRMEHEDQSNENSKVYEFDVLTTGSPTPEYIKLLFEDFFNGEYGGKVNNEAGLFKVELIGQDGNGNTVTESITQPNIKITQYETNNDYVFKIDESYLHSTSYNYKFYLTEVKFYYKAPMLDYNALSPSILLFTTTYPTRSPLAIDIPNSDPATKGIYLDETISNIKVSFDYKVIISK